MLAVPEAGGQSLLSVLSAKSAVNRNAVSRFMAAFTGVRCRLFAGFGHERRESNFFNPPLSDTQSPARPDTNVAIFFSGEETEIRACLKTPWGPAARNFGRGQGAVAARSARSGL